MFKGKSREAPKAKVKYFVKARVVTSALKDHELKHKQVLAIREEPVKLKTDAVIEETCEIKTWGCCSQGASALKAEFNKNVFTPREVAEGEININNSACKLAVTDVCFFIEQVITQKIKAHRQEERIIIIKKNIPGPAAGANW